MIRRKSCSALLIGNELLSGKTRDSNGHFLANTCARIGLTLSQIRVIPDDTPTIIQNVHQLSSTTDYVFTSGGVGPTHDDITYQSMGAAFQDPLKYHKPTMARMQEYYQKKKVPFTDARKRMALFPSTAKVFFSCDSSDESAAVYEDDSILKPLVPFPNESSPPATSVWTPIVIMKNVHILPGIPSLYSHLVTTYFDHYLIPHLSALSENKTPLVKKMLGSIMMEGDLADHLTHVQNEYAGRVNIGSYPKWSLKDTEAQKDDIRVVITFEGDHEKDVNDAISLASKKISLKALQ